MKKVIFIFLLIAFLSCSKSIPEPYQKGINAMNSWYYDIAISHFMNISKDDKAYYDSSQIKIKECLFSIISSGNWEMLYKAYNLIKNEKLFSYIDKNSIVGSIYKFIDNKDWKTSLLAIEILPNDLIPDNIKKEIYEKIKSGIMVFAKTEYRIIKGNLSNYSYKAISDNSDYGAGVSDVISAYYTGNDIKCIVDSESGEGGGNNKEFYFSNDNLFFAYEGSYSVNMDDMSMADNKENRYYFNNGKMILWLAQGKKIIVTTSDKFKKKEKEINDYVSNLHSKAKDLVYNNSSQPEISSDQNNQASTESNSDSKLSDTDFDGMIKAYENYYNQYFNLIRKAQNNDMTALAEYPSMLQKAQDLQTKLQNYQGQMTASQLDKWMGLYSKLMKKAMELQ